MPLYNKECEIEIKIEDNKSIRDLLESLSHQSDLDNENYFGIYLDDIRGKKILGLYTNDYHPVSLKSLAIDYVGLTLYVDYISK